MPTLTVAFCTFKRAGRLEKLLAALRAQSCPIPFEILAVNNHSPDNTLEVLGSLQQQSGAPLRVVTEMTPGIVPARNRAIEESLDSDMLAFIDDDELPQPGWLAAAYDAMTREGAQCVGGRIAVDFSPHAPPAWLDHELREFLGEVDHGSRAFWITDDSAPVWSGNVAYDMGLFRHDAALRFDTRYNRSGEAIGGGEDAMMFRTLLSRATRIRYRPDMAIMHSVDPWKLQRGYFLRLHFLAGLRHGQFSLPDYPKTLFGIPPFMISQLLGQSAKALKLAISGKPGVMRQAMNAAHALGSLQGYRKRHGE